MNYTWKVVNTTIKDSSDLSKIVISCAWYKQGEDQNGNVGRCYGNTQFDSTVIDINNFIEFDNLSEDIVLQWIQNTINESHDLELNACILKDLEKFLYPETTVLPPWN